MGEKGPGVKTPKFSFNFKVLKCASVRAADVDARKK